MKKRKNKKEYFFAVKFSLSRFFCAELTGCTDVLHVPFIELSLALNSAGFFRRSEIFRKRNNFIWLS